ncbi:hypothetical protein D3C87_1771490 [compost metagenome]
MNRNTYRLFYRHPERLQGPRLAVLPYQRVLAIVLILDLQFSRLDDLFSRLNLHKTEYHLQPMPLVHIDRHHQVFFENCRKQISNLTCLYSKRNLPDLWRINNIHL